MTNQEENKKDVFSALEGLTKVVELKTNVGSALVTEYGARILGVFIGERPNPFWTARNPQEVIRNRDWNIGGNRLWISPERNFYYRKPEKFEEWFCQSALDPGNWRIISCGEKNVTLEEEVELKDFLNNISLHMLLSRQISASGTQLKKNLVYMRLWVKDAIIVKGDLKNGVNLWALTQIRPGEDRGGTAIIPTRRKARPIHYFREIPKNRLRTSKDHVSFRIDGLEVYKLGIAPEDTFQEGCSIILYYVEHGREVFLLSMKTMMAPTTQEECLDVAKANPSGPKGCIQSYNSGPDLCFGEMELHFKPVVRVKDSWISYADYEIDIFAGSRGEILGVLRKTIPKPFLFQC
ncbi:MAG: hypothetical protein FGF52_02625 [Candidatus Brockarchaeota archaeon]|nr:hypothetical protein [Candidatus Brockarchaeota archaeon]